MTIWARAVDNRIQETSDADGQPESIADNEVWLQVPAELEPWFTLDYVVQDGGVTPPSLDYFKGQVIAALAAHRWEVQNGNFYHRGVVYRTDTASLAMMQGKLELMRGLQTNDPENEGAYRISWKGINGFAKVDYADLNYVAPNIGLMIQDAFDTEERLTTETLNTSSVTEAIGVYTTGLLGAWTRFAPVSDIMAEPEPVDYGETVPEGYENGGSLEPTKEPSPTPDTEPTPEPTPAADESTGDPEPEPDTEPTPAEEPVSEEPAEELPVEEPVAEEPLAEEENTPEEPPAEESVAEEPIEEEPATEPETDVTEPEPEPELTTTTTRRKK